LVTTTLPRFAVIANAHRVDDHIGTLSPGQFHDEFLSLLAGRHRVRSSELEGLLPLEIRRIDGDDVLCADERSALHSIYADSTGADYYDCVARSGVSSQHHRTPPGDDAASEQTRFVESDPWFDLDAVRLADNSVLSESAQQAHQSEILPPRMVSCSVIGDLSAVTQVLAVLTQVLHSSRTR
jgi:hypothetical protein